MATKTKPVGCEFCRGEIDHKALGRKMGALRTAAGLTQKRLAEILSISEGFLSDLENGRRNWTPQRVEGVTIACRGAS